MKLKKDVKLVEVLRFSKMCKEDVFFKTEEGDVLNLKSLLSSVLLQSIAHDKELIAKGQIVCINEKDYEVLAEFLE